MSNEKIEEKKKYIEVKKTDWMMTVFLCIAFSIPIINLILIHEFAKSIGDENGMFATYTKKYYIKDE